MAPSETLRLPLHLVGVVRSVDPVGRELEVHVAQAAARFDVPPDCLIVLRGERVKMRLIQPRDRVWVRYAEVPGRRVAEAVEVLPGGPAVP